MVRVPLLLFWLLNCSLSLLTGCANTPLGTSVGESLSVESQTNDGQVADSKSAADSKLKGQTERPSPPAPSSGQAQDSSAPASGEPQGVQTQPSKRFTDLEQAPIALQSYLKDVANLGVLTPIDTQGKGTTGFTEVAFGPNQPIARREYARWLVAANNALYDDRPAEQIRLAVVSNPPIYSDVPATDPDFPAIQGLAEAGVLPSTLSGDLAATTFRPNGPLSREALLLWKVPLDQRNRILPTADGKAVQQSWGFQDSDKITAQSQRTVLADFQNGDQANIRRAFGYTRLFQPQKSVTRAEAAATLWYFGSQGEGLSAQDVVGRSPANPQPPANSPKVEPR